MATIKPVSTSKIDIEIKITLSEAEANALLNIVGYGHKPFTEWFYKHLGKHYLQPHEKGLISLFETVKKELPQHLKKIAHVRKVISEVGI